MTEHAPSPPLILRLLPEWPRVRLYNRYYSHRHAQWTPLFVSAPLRFATGCKMVDLVPGDLISGHIAFNGAYEPGGSREMVARAAKGGLMVDVGANMGYYSLLWAATRADNRVVAFEASPRVLPLLERNVAVNGLDGQITVVPKAASDREGTVNFDVGPVEQTGWGGMNPDQQGGVTVPMIRLDDYFADQTIALLKIDTEGSDALVIKGCEKLLRARRIGVITYEQNFPRMAELGIDPQDIVNWLADTGYTTRPTNAIKTQWEAVPTA